MGTTCQVTGRPCGALRDLPGVRSRILTLARGERVRVDGEGLESVRTVHSGLAALCATLPDGRRQLLCLAGPGEALCSAAAPGVACWVEALAPSVVCEIELSAEALHGEQLGGVLGAMAELLRRRLESTYAHLVALGRLDGTERLAAFLVDMARRIGRFEQDVWHLPLPMTRDDIADHLGLNADTITRILRRLESDGLLEGRGGPEWRLPDLAALEARAPGLGAAVHAPACAVAGGRAAPLAGQRPAKS